MKWIDTHAHLFVKEFNQDRDEMIRRAQVANIEKIVLPNIDINSIAPMFELADKYTGYCYATLGIHPCSVSGPWERELSDMMTLSKQNKVVGIGETGMDMYWDKSTIDIQREAFEAQIEWAKETGLPIIIHSRDCQDLTISLIEKHKDERLKGIFHCFSGTLEEAKRVRDLDFYMGIGGVVTFKKAAFRDYVDQYGMEHIVLETDAPYLSPVPFRGKRNESSYVVHVGEELADLCGVDLIEFAEITTNNAKQLFEF